MLPQLTRKTACIAVLALTALALGIRLAGIGFNLPHGSLGDEAIYASPFLSAAGDPEFDPASSEYYPQLVPRLARLLSLDSHPTLNSLEDHIAHASAGVLLLRRLVACISVLIVPATYLIARRFMSRIAAVLAAGLMSTSFLDLWFSQQARPHAAFAALSAVTLVGALEVRRRADGRAWLCAGLACALAIGTLQTGFLLLGPLVAAHLHSGRRRTKRAHVLALVVVALVVVGALQFYPSVTQHQGTMQRDTAAWKPLLQWISQNFTGHGIARSLQSLWEYEPWLSLCAAVGAGVVCCSLITRRALRSPSSDGAISGQRVRDLIVIAAFVLPLACFVGGFEYSAQRYLLPFLPVLACCAAGGLEIVCEWIAERRGWPATRLFLSAAAGMFALQVACALALVHVRVVDDTSTEAAKWIDTHVERGSDRIMFCQGLEMPLLRDESSNAWLVKFAGYTHNAWIAYQYHLDPSVRSKLGWRIDELPLGTPEELARFDADPDRYVDGLPAEIIVLALPTRGMLQPRLREALRRRGMTARFSPWRFDLSEGRPFLRNEHDDPDIVDGNWVYHALRARCLGPVIEIYRIHASAK